MYILNKTIYKSLTLRWGGGVLSNVSKPGCFEHKFDGYQLIYYESMKYIIDYYAFSVVNTLVLSTFMLIAYLFFVN